MTYEKASIIVLCSFIMLTTGYYAYSADNAQEQLEQYVSELQKNPNDTPLREKIIRHVQTMKSVPRIPEDADRYMARGKAAFEMAKDINGFAAAAAEFKKAVDVAPWFADGYYNLGHAQESAGNFTAAMQSFRFYLLLSPHAKDFQVVKNRIYGLEYKAERQREQLQKDAQQKAAQEDATKSQFSLAGYWRDMAGSRYLLQIDGNRYTIIRVMACWRLPSEYWGQCPDLRPDNTLYHHGTFAAGVVTGFSVNTMNHNTGTCSVPTGNYPITQSELTKDGKQLTITATNPNCPSSSFLLGPRVYRRDD